MNNAELEQMKTRLLEVVESVTTKSKSGGYVCPLCGSGTGVHGTGAFSVYDNGTRWKCFSCGKGGDVFDLVGELKGLPDTRERIKATKEILGAETMSDKNLGFEFTFDGNELEKVKQEQPPEKDLTDFLLQAAEHISDTDYHRGISLETLKRFKVGYAPDWAIHEGLPTSPRLIIPTSRYSYIARDTREGLTDQQKRFSKMKKGKTHLFNINALTTAQSPIWIVEGEIDALSIIDVGGEAVSLGSTSMVKQFLKLIKDVVPRQPLIVAMDNDPSGKKAAEELCAGLKAAGISFTGYSWEGGKKDANEVLMSDRAALEKVVHEGKNTIITAEERYSRTSVDYYLQDFQKKIANGANKEPISTGFETLDKAIGGGLLDGLYVVGAISSLGKTALMGQIWDNVAAGGHDVLIFSLEMSKDELIARSVSRHTLTEALKAGCRIDKAKSALGITLGSRYRFYDDTDRKLISNAINAYGAYAGHIYIKEGQGKTGINQIKAAVGEHYHLTGRKPVVVIDYLQILEPDNMRATDKQNTDKAVKELKQLSRDYQIPVIAISSFNRANYSVAVGMEAFKESGAIEYSADVLIGLQLKGAGQEGFDVNAAKAKDTREIEAVILKNRKGRAGGKIGLYYKPMYNYFEEMTE